MLVLNVNKTKMIRLAKNLGYDPPHYAQFTKLFRRRTWWLEWYDNTGFYSATISTAAGKAFFGMRFNDWAGSPEKWTAKTLSLEKLGEYDLVKERAPKAPAAAPYRAPGYEVEQAIRKGSKPGFLRIQEATEEEKEK